jgi:iron(III) transport system ATP-binding protein
VTLAAAEGEFVCFLGPSGCGKTTLLRIVAGLERQDAGLVLMGGRDVSRLPPSQRGYGIVFQSYALFPNLTVARNVAYGLQARRAARARVEARVDALLDLVGLRAHKQRYPAQLSGGEQQRVALARALAPSPALLLLDEPLSALDARVRLALRREMKDLQRRLGITTIMVTHDQEEALTMADRIVVMNHGVIEQVGSALDIYREPASPFVADFVGKVNVLAGTAHEGGVRVGSMVFRSSAKPRNGNVRIYLRPEDIVARPIAPGDANVFDARIEKIEFLGSYCLVHVATDGLGQPLTVYLSLNFLSEESLEPGKSLKLRILPERLRLFDG